jgi:hypothetical protein
MYLGSNWIWRCLFSFADSIDPVGGCAYVPGRNPSRASHRCFEVVSRRFASLGLSWRIAVALGDLYVATFLFILAGGVARLLFEFSGLPQQLAPRVLVLDPVMGAFFGLTYTGYFLVLWPLSYVNHVFVARAWSEGGDR